jgi:two-component system response regulator NreC
MGYIIKRSDIDELILAINLVRRGNTYFSNELAEKLDLVQLMHEAQSGEYLSDVERLSPREREVLQLIAEGYTGREIAEKLFISPKTVEGHRTHLLEKLGARNRADLIRVAIVEGMLSEEQAPGASSALGDCG